MKKERLNPKELAAPRRRLERRHRARGALVQRLPLFRGRDVARRPVQEPRSHRVFQPSDSAACISTAMTKHPNRLTKSVP